ncbi:ATP-grasp domain-containing protein [Podospora didyma]|uniref:ATP-grasp domain-containing protein n=1 Tax=Podospora didyma TaxID=330526 RepID=A0AAE0N4F3_9PEZI|nr:ATP-grasp domain-containing protein [Podospora didyma]
MAVAGLLLDTVDRQPPRDVPNYPQNHSTQTPLLPGYHQEDNFRRPFFWEVVPLCELYSIAHVVVLPPLVQGRAHTAAAVNSRPKTNGHRVNPAQGPSDRLVDALISVGFDPVSWVTSDGVSVFTIILPSTSGYVTRSDFLSLRLQDCAFSISNVYEKLLPLEFYNAAWSSWTVDNSEASLSGLVEHSAGIVQWADLSSSVSIWELQNHLFGLTQEVKDRLGNAPWMSPQPISHKRVALVRGRPNITAGGPVYRSAAALGLDLVIVDDEGHWLQQETDETKGLREAFLATDMTEDAGVADRIISSLKQYPLPIHGIFTLSDNFFVTVARVAEALGLPASPVSAFETAVDKYLSRLLQDEPGQTARVTSINELESLLAIPTDGQQPIFSPVFPMIVKPTKGWSSECVSRVSKREDLMIAVEKATRRHGSAAVIEPFFDGPEIDVNFVLLDGEILFSEIADEPPCQADARDATVHDTFSPEALTLPSALPLEEQEIAKSTLRDILVNLGFRTGVFHVEARMVNSSCEYRDLNGDGVMDLMQKSCFPLEKAACRLLEINARPPGYRVTVPSKHTYGVDYFAAHMLASVGDHDRLRITTSSFGHVLPDGSSQGAQYWSRLVYIPAPAEGTVQWTSQLSPCEELKQRRPDLAPWIVLGVDYCVPGEKISLYTDGARTYVAHLLVCSRVSRRGAIEVGNEVLRAFKIDVVQEDL